MLNELVINNGELSPKFDIYIDTYTVLINDDIESLDIHYEVSENVSVNIYNNTNLNTDKTVIISLNNGNSIKNIILNVVHENIQTTTGLQDYFQSLEIKKEEEISPYVAPLIGASCFLIIIITFSILFHKKRITK